MNVTHEDIRNLKPKRYTQTCFSPVTFTLTWWPSYTWQMIAASCPTALGALCSQLTFPLAWCCEHSAVTATELLQPLDLSCGTVFRSRHHLRTSDDSWSDNFFGKYEHSALWLLMCRLLTYIRTWHRYTEDVPVYQEQTI